MSPHQQPVRAFLIAVALASCLLAHPAAAKSLSNVPSSAQTLAMLESGQFVELNRRYGAAQSLYDSGQISDITLRAMFRHFYHTAPALEARYASWVERMPHSYVAHVARAIYYLRVGENRRGENSIGDTSASQIQGMDAAFSLALEELKKSRPLEKKPLLSYFYALDVSKYEGGPEESYRLLRSAIAIDPRNAIVREMYMMTLATAWGGSDQEMEGFLRDCERSGLPAAELTRLRAQIVANDAWVDEFVNKQYERAGKEYLRANSLFPDEACLLCAGRSFLQANDYRRAVAAYSEVLRMDPKSAVALSMRSYAYDELHEPQQALRDLRRAAAMHNGYAEYNLATAYLFGQDVPKDKGLAIFWTRRAAADGMVQAQDLLPKLLDSRYTIVQGPQG